MDDVRSSDFMRHVASRGRNATTQATGPSMLIRVQFEREETPEQTSDKWTHIGTGVTPSKSNLSARKQISAESMHAFRDKSNF